MKFIIFGYDSYMRLLFTYLFAWLLTAILTTSAWCDDLIVARDVLQDRAGTLTIEQVVKADFKPTGLVFTKGYTDAVHWLRLRVKAPEHVGEVELRIRPTYLDELQLFEPDPASPGGWKIHISGDRYPFGERERAAITFGFIVHPQSAETTYYLRLKTTSTSMLNVEALEPRLARLKDLRLDLFQVFYLGIMVWLLIWAFNDFIENRQSVTGWFLIYQLSFIAYDLALMGYLAPFVPDNYPNLADQITSLLVISTVFLSAVFNRILFRPYAPPAILMRGLEGLMLLYPLQLIALVTGYTRMALQANSMIILLMAALFFVLPLTARRESVPSRRVLRIIYSLQTFSLLVSMLPILGLVEAVEWSLQATIIHGLISGSFMVFMLHLRSRQLRREWLQASHELAQSTLQLQLERSQKEEQGHFMSMLNHELKTPLSVIRMVLGTPAPTQELLAHAKLAVHDMNNVVERCLQAEKLVDQQLTGHIVECKLLDEINELRRNSSAPERLDINTKIFPTLKTDVQLLRIIVANLIDNAIKYSPPDSCIQLEVARDHQDSGEGISVVVQNSPGSAGWPDPEKVFQKYYRGKAAHQQIGTGLGLYLVKNMVHQMGGQVSYVPDNLTVRFKLWLPT